MPGKASRTRPRTQGRSPLIATTDVTPDATQQDRKRKLADRWGGHDRVLDDGFVAVPRSFLKFAGQLRPHSLSPAQIVFVLNLMFHKWDSARPFPAYRTIATRMGISVKYARDIARQLEAKGLLSRERRTGRTNRFELQPLFDALAKHVAERGAKTPAR